MQGLLFFKFEYSFEHIKYKQAFNVFESYLLEEKIELDLESVKTEELNKIMEKFYVEVRKQDGELYSKSTLLSIRFGIQRMINEMRKDVQKYLEFLSESICESFFKGCGI